MKITRVVKRTIWDLSTIGSTLIEATYTENQPDPVIGTGLPIMTVSFFDIFADINTTTNWNSVDHSSISRAEALIPTPAAAPSCPPGP